MKRPLNSVALPLHERERWVVGVDEVGLAPFVPRVTLTLPALASTREMLFLVTGEDKREILSRVLAGARVWGIVPCCDLIRRSGGRNSQAPSVAKGRPRRIQGWR
jgi:hypothetical protein